MVTAQDIWDIITDTWIELSKQYEPVLETAAKSAGLDLRTWSLLLAVVTFEPEDTTPAHLMVRSPYSTPELYFSRLDAAARKGFLQEVEPGKFRLTHTGRNITIKLIDVARDQMAKVDPLSEDEAESLRQYLDRLVQSCLATPPPPNTWSIQLSCKLMPDASPPLPYIEQAISALLAFRDDAHLAAWQKTDLSATSLEILTLLWNGEVSSLDQIYSRLERRGHPLQVYQNGLDVLRSQGLVNGSVDALWITGIGRVFRNQIEDDTLKYFFTPWSSLSESDLTHIQRLFRDLKDGLMMS